MTPRPPVERDAPVATPVPAPSIRRIFRDVVADRLPDRRPPQAALLFGPADDPYRDDDGGFLADFFSEILHQDTCLPGTADGVPLLAALAVDDRVPARHRFTVVDLLFRTATVTDRHRAESWPAAPRHADPGSEARARSAVRVHTPALLARWEAECPAVQLALAGLSVALPTPRTLDATENLTAARRPATPRGAPPRARALHLLGQMLTATGQALAPTKSSRAR
ncbi:hypothetical protein [Streptomyces liangshanensis]|uniref:Uncharacterized protein n=1 Tax=Streptomyces liangshanensis TaxID=2717324 RepID=A0A6G9GZC7_9ACTN|nr:hypothetical protein [Streptomyces liangshanensis]QIQ03628.1 hypothetical protein HA039_15970 [Streptomyces liangshanensis]